MNNNRVLMRSTKKLEQFESPVFFTEREIITKLASKIYKLEINLDQATKLEKRRSKLNHENLTDERCREIAVERSNRGNYFLIKLNVDLFENLKGYHSRLFFLKNVCDHKIIDIDSSAYWRDCVGRYLEDVDYTHKNAILTYNNKNYYNCKKSCNMIVYLTSYTCYNLFLSPKGDCIEPISKKEFFKIPHVKWDKESGDWDMLDCDDEGPEFHIYSRKYLPGDSVYGFDSKTSFIISGGDDYNPSVDLPYMEEQEAIAIGKEFLDNMPENGINSDYFDEFFKSKGALDEDFDYN